MRAEIIERISELISQEPYWIPVMSNASAMLHQEREDIEWAGFHLLQKNPVTGGKELVLGPFQGKPAGIRIPLGQGVCGVAAAEDETMYVPEVSQSSIYIDWFSDVKAEFVVPLHNSAGEVIGVMTVDSSRVDPFSKADRDLLREFAKTIESGISGFEEQGYVDYRRALRRRRSPIENPRVVYQGEPGAYSEMASIDFFGDSAEITGLYAFEDTFRALKEGRADYAVLPIENSSTGVIRQVYDLLAQYECYMVGETTVKVQHSFMVLPGANIDEIDAVYSHEQGLFQCEAFLDQHPDWKRVPQEDTAGSARMIAEMGNPKKAAICSKRAAELYGLEVIYDAVNSNQSNTTRFVVIAPNIELREGADKICISFMTPHKPGALHEVLTIFTVRGLNLMRLESRPIPEHNWEYMFFVEFTGNVENDDMDDVIRELAKTTENLRVYGNFQSNL